jgi:hypothetical protein
MLRLLVWRWSARLFAPSGNQGRPGDPNSCQDWPVRTGLSGSGDEAAFGVGAITLAYETAVFRVLAHNPLA